VAGVNARRCRPSAAHVHMFIAGAGAWACTGGRLGLFEVAVFFGRASGVLFRVGRCFLKSRN
jgi:hypothetical protein